MPLAIIRLAAIQSFMWVACTCRRFAERENLDRRTRAIIAADVDDEPSRVIEALLIEVTKTRARLKELEKKYQAMATRR
jgi:hypothetical protein